MADWPLILQTAYAELLERSDAAAFDDAFAEAGTFVAKTIKGRRYWYFQTTKDGARPQKYVGPESPDLLARIKTHKHRQNDERERRVLVSTLLRSGHLPRIDPATGDVLDALARAGLFRLRGVLVGTLAFQTYSAMLGVRLPAQAARTGDIDIAQDRAVSIAVEDRSLPVADVLSAADSRFRSVPHRTDSRRTASYTTGELRVDFLTPNRQADTDSPAKLPAFGTDAQQLRFLDFLIRDPERAVVLHASGVPVSVPSPERYALHKLIVAQRRRAGEAKREKDILQASALLAALLRKRPLELKDRWEEATGRGPGWKKLLTAGLALLAPQVRDGMLRTLGLSRAALSGLDLRFDDPPAHYDHLRDIVVFSGVAGEDRVQCAISRAALDDHFGADGLDAAGRVRCFHEHRGEIQALARVKYLQRPVEEPDICLLRTEDIAGLRSSGKTARGKPKRSRG